MRQSTRRHSTSGTTDAFPNVSPRMLRKNKDVKIDVHPLDLAAPPIIRSGAQQQKGKWIKGVSAAVQVPSEVITTLDDEIEARHAGSTSRAEEILWHQEPRPFKETIRGSWAAALCLTSIVVALFGGVAIGLFAPAYLIGTAILPSIISVLLCYLLATRIRCDIAGHYVLTKQRALIVVPKRHLKVFPPITVSFDFTFQRSLIMHKFEQAGIHETVLKGEPILCDLFHTKHSIGAVTFYPRTKLQAPIYFENIQHSHAFEMVFNDAVMSSAAPTNGGRMRLEKPTFEQQKAASKKYKVYPFLGILWIILLLATVTAPAWVIYSFQQYKSPAVISLTVLAWISVQATLFALFYPLYRFGKSKCEARANGRYMKFMVDVK